jgi:hypothetical protein
MIARNGLILALMITGLGSQVGPVIAVRMQSSFRAPQRTSFPRLYQHGRDAEVRIVHALPRREQLPGYEGCTSER